MCKQTASRKKGASSHSATGAARPATQGCSTNLGPSISALGIAYYKSAYTAHHARAVIQAHGFISISEQCLKDMKVLK